MVILHHVVSSFSPQVVFHKEGAWSELRDGSITELYYQFLLVQL